MVGGIILPEAWQAQLTHNIAIATKDLYTGQLKLKFIFHMNLLIIFSHFLSGVFRLITVSLVSYFIFWTDIFSSFSFEEKCYDLQFSFLHNNIEKIGKSMMITQSESALLFFQENQVTVAKKTQSWWWERILLTSNLSGKKLKMNLGTFNKILWSTLECEAVVTLSLKGAAFWCSAFKWRLI